MARTGLVTAMLPPDVGGTQVVVWRLFKDDPGVVVVSGAGSASAARGALSPAGCSHVAAAVPPSPRLSVRARSDLGGVRRRMAGVCRSTCGAVLC